MPLTAVDFDPFADDQQTSRLTPVDFNPFEGTTMPGEPERTIPGHLREVGVGIPAGAVSAVGTGLRGAAANFDAWGPRYQELLRSIESADIPEGVTAADLEARFEAPQPSPLAMMTGQADPMRRAEPDNPLAALDESIRFADVPNEMRTKLRTALRGRIEGAENPLDEARAAIPTPVRERGLWKAGEAVSEFAEETFPARPGYEGALSRQVGEGLGSLATGVAAALTPGVGTLAATGLFTTMGAGEAADRAVAAGASDEDITRAAFLGLGAGGTDVAPVEALLGRLPIPGARAIAEATKRLGGARVARAIGRIGAQATVEAAQEGGQEALQNLIAREVHSPETVIMEGVEAGAGVGGIVGGIAQLTREGVLGIATRRSRSARGNRARAVAEVPPPTPADEASPIQTADIQEGKERVADAQAITAINEWADIEGLPKHGQPVRIVKGRDVVEGIVTDGWQDDDPGMTVTTPDGDVIDYSLADLQRIGAQVTGLPMPAAESDIAKRRAEVEKEAADQIREADKQAAKQAETEAKETEKVARSADGALVLDALAGKSPTADGGRLGEALAGMSGTPQGTKMLEALAGRSRSAPGDMVMRALAGQGPQMNAEHLGLALTGMKGSPDGDAVLEALAGRSPTLKGEEAQAGLAGKPPTAKVSPGAMSGKSRERRRAVDIPGSNGGAFADGQH